MFEFIAVRVGEVPSQAKQDAAYRVVLLADPCAYCGAPAVVTDHIAPRATGGQDGWENATAACHRCNSKKSCSSLLAFLTGLPIGPNRWMKEKARRDLYRAERGGYLAEYIERMAA